MRRYVMVSLAAMVAACQERTPQDGAAPQRPSLAIERTMAEARQAIAAAGETELAMKRIEAALAKLAGEPDLRTQAPPTALHGSSAMRSWTLSSDGDDGISLFIVHFAPNTATPPHDHLTWGVLHVLEGRDTYVRFERFEGADAGPDHDRARVRRKAELVLGPGESTYWLPPPDDVHSQKTENTEVWELILAGRNLLAEGVTRHRHYFDPESGRVVSRSDRAR